MINIQEEQWWKMTIDNGNSACFGKSMTRDDEKVRKLNNDSCQSRINRDAFTIIEQPAVL